MNTNTGYTRYTGPRSISEILENYRAAYHAGGDGQGAMIIDAAYQYVTNGQVTEDHLTALESAINKEQ